MKYDEFLDLSDIAEDVRKASFDNCLLNPEIVFWGKEWLHRKNKKSLILQGIPGCGKTFFSIALLETLWKSLLPHPFIIFKTSNQLDTQLLNAVMGKSQHNADSIIRMCVDSTIFFLDDLGVETSSERIQRQYLEILNHRCSQNKVTVLSTNNSIKQIREKFGHRIYSRIKNFTLVKFPKIDYRGVM